MLRHLEPSTVVAFTEELRQSLRSRRRSTGRRRPHRSAGNARGLSPDPRRPKGAHRYRLAAPLSAHPRLKNCSRARPPRRPDRALAVVGAACRCLSTRRRRGRRTSIAPVATSWRAGGAAASPAPARPELIDIDTQEPRPGGRKADKPAAIARRGTRVRMGRRGHRSGAGRGVRAGSAGSPAGDRRIDTLLPLPDDRDALRNCAAPCTR